MINFKDFTSKSPKKTPPMKVTVTDKGGTVVDKFYAPEGFQLERYARSLWNNKLVRLSTDEEGNLVVEVFKNDTYPPLAEELLLKYTGIYAKNGKSND